MRFARWLRSGAVAIAILILSIPFAIVLTILSAPFWSWIDVRLGIEAYGHSGPADWCYLLTWGMLVALVGWLWARKK